MVQAWPPILHSYVQHVAEIWQRELGRRPAIRVVNWAALKPYDLQPQIDPSVDLARAPLPWFGHASWIPPLERRLRPDARRP
jgi:hypothetical protein